MEGPKVILLIEDDYNDVFFVSRALDQLNFAGKLQRVCDVEEAKAYLMGSNSFHDRQQFPLPDVIISDSATARGSAVELREWIKVKTSYEKVPFVILSGGISIETRQRAGLAGIHLIFEKVIDLRGATDQMKVILREVSHLKV